MKGRTAIRVFLIFSLFFLTSFAYLKAQKEKSEVDEEMLDLIYYYSTKGFENYYVNLDSAEYYLQKALDLQYSTSGYQIDDRVAINHNALASFYRKIYNNVKALEHYNKAEAILNSYDPKHKLLGGLYHNKGNVYKSMNDFYRTKEYYEYALDFLVNNGYEDDDDFTFIFSHYISLLIELGEYQLAEEKLSEFELNRFELSPYIQHGLHITKAAAYSNLGNYEAAIFHFEQAIKLRGQITDSNQYNRQIIRYYYNIIDFYTTYEEYNKALIECNKAFAFIESLDPQSTKSKTSYNSDIMFRTASIHYLKGDFTRSLMITNRAIDLLNNFLADLSYDGNIETAKREFTTTLPDLYVLRSRLLFNSYNEDLSLNTLNQAFDSYKQSVNTLNLIKLSMEDENSVLFATSQILDVYYEAIYVGIQLFNRTNKLEHLETSFEFAESSKSFALYSEIKDVEAIEFSGLSPEIKDREDRIVGEINRYEELLYSEELSQSPNLELIESYKERLFHLEEDYDELKQELELSNSKYYELKYRTDFISLEEVKKELPYRDALIEYVLTDTTLITYVIDRKGINVFSQEIDSNFDEECLEYYRLIHDQNFSGGVHGNYRRFAELGRKFYQILIEPALRYTDRKSFTIIPDGAIMYLPFEAFLTENADLEYINYLDLPYMIREYSIGYSHSSTLMFSERLKTKSPERKVLAFAPKYKDLDDNMIAQFVRQVGDNEVLFPLRGIIKEVQSINETVPARVFLNENATEHNFKKYASDYSILHLAMHTIMRDDEPLYSHLAFTNAIDADSTEDNKLYAYEIYNLQLNAQMAVLSSCSSGFGRMHKGEGMMSLARGFIYAGCPSIIMTLWQVSDQSSSDLMTSFYRYLKKGQSKQEAMRRAKIEYLENADDLTSNPYFWSGFVVVGDGSPVYRKSGLAYWMIIITVFIGAILFFQYKRS